MTEPNNRQRKIIHIDMDCFYAAVEMRDNPALKNIPLAVGGAADKRGVVSTCNYIAREYGIHSAMATGYALRLCPQLTVIPGRMKYYRSISQQIRAIFRRYTSIIEPLSLDEAYLDVTDIDLCNGSATLMAEEMRSSIQRELNLTASAGIAPNKFLAKIGSDENKPDGQCVITPDAVDDFVKQLSLKKIPGVGKVTSKRLARYGLETCADVRAMGKQALILKLGSFGEHLYRRSLGIDHRELNTQWIRKSLSVERTYSVDIATPEAALVSLKELYLELVRRLQAHQSRTIKNLQIKLKFSNFQQTTMERAASQLQQSVFESLLPLAWERGNGLGIRLLGIGVSFNNVENDSDQQLDLFS